MVLHRRSARAEAGDEAATSGSLPLAVDSYMAEEAATTPLHVSSTSMPSLLSREHVEAARQRMLDADARALQAVAASAIAQSAAHQAAALSKAAARDAAEAQHSWNVLRASFVDSSVAQRCYKDALHSVFKYRTTTH
jgi:hypothetical protein